MMTTPSTETRAAILLPWGPGSSLGLEIPDAWKVDDVAWPDLSDPLDDYPSALHAGRSDGLEGGLSPSIP